MAFRSAARRTAAVTDSPLAPPSSGPAAALPPGEERPTLKTIAIETGLAIATVSRALKDAPDIGEETKTAPAFVVVRGRPTSSPSCFRPRRM